MPNISTERDRHRWVCEHWTDEGQTNDVKWCEHGKILRAYYMLGSTSIHWETLSPIWTPIAYRRARRALSDEQSYGVHIQLGGRLKP